MTTAIIKAITIGISILTSAILTGCDMNTVTKPSTDELVTNSYYSTTTTPETSAIVEENTTTTTSSTTTTTTAPTTTTQAPTTTTAPAVTTTPATTTAPKPQVTTTTTPPTTTTAPVPAVHDCSRDGHNWETVYIESEPKWCQEIHLVWDSGFDWDLARQLYPNINDPYEVMKDNFAKLTGYPSAAAATGSATVKVEVWGTETWKYKECSVCHERYTNEAEPISINPIGEWQYVNGVNPRNGGIAFNTLWYDPYNIPQDVIDTMIRLWDEW